MLLTHDRRVRVFVSSTLNEAAEERQAARAAIEGLHLTPVMFDLGARPHPPQQLYRSYLEQSDVFVGIYLEQYGWVGPGAEISGLEDEFRLAGDRPKLMYLKTPAPARDPRLTAMIEQLWAEAGTSTSNYHDPAELQRLISDDLAVLLSERFAQPGPEAAGDAGLTPVRPPAAATDLVGRADDLARVVGLLGGPDARLVTLTGPGGVGKTRLALEVVRAAPGFDLLAFADLAAVTDADQVPTAIATALGVSSLGTAELGARDPADVVADRIGTRRVLLLLDNVEHVLRSAPAVARLLAAAPGLVVLATSRTALRLRAEREVPIDPLDPAHAVRLFEERVRKVRPGFTVDDANRAAVTEIVRRLEGIPLAIELAAARARLLPPHALLSHLGNTLDLRAADIDVPDRQFTLRCTIGWSFDLLTDSERAVLEQVSVFPSSWSVDGATAVVAPRPGSYLLDDLSELVQQSLVVAVDGAAGPRFRPFESVRAYAAERLDDEGRDVAMRRLADYLIGLGSQAEQAAGTPAGRTARAGLDDDLDAVRAVFGWSVERGDADLAVRLGAAAARYLWSRSMLAELADLVERTARMPAAAALPDAAVAQLTWARGSIALGVGRFDDARRLLERALELAAASGDDRLLAHARFSLAIALPYDEAAGRMGELLGAALAAFEAADDSWGVSASLIPLGEMALRTGDLARARELHQRALARAERIDDEHLIGQCLNQLAMDALLQGAREQARDLLLRAAGIYRTLPDQEGLAYCLDGFAALLLFGGDPTGAARLLGTSSRVREVTGIAVWPLMQPLMTQFVAAVRATAGGSFDPAHAEGAAAPAMTALDAAVAANG